jgi:DNA mismatch repair protein MutL
MASQIRPISNAVVHRMCSDQVIIDLPSALKELLENALDAGANRIDVRLKEHGVELLEVSDNGKGIPSCDLDGIALRHHTSKLREFDDLQRLSSFGFRGEALNSLAALSTLGLSTRTAGDVSGTALAFSKDGTIETRTPVARDLGTCVSVCELFGPFPVRRKALERSAMAEFRRMVALLQAYAVICDHVRFCCMHSLAKGGKQVLMQTTGAGGQRAAIAAVFGAKLLGELTPFRAQEGAFGLSGFISRPRAGDGRRSGDRQYIFVNNRPVDFGKLSRLLNEAYRAATARPECFPVTFINVRAPTDSYDVNVTPDKRTVLFSDESALLALVKRTVDALFAPETCALPLQQPALTFAAAPSAEPLEESISLNGVSVSDASAASDGVSSADSPPAPAAAAVAAAEVAVTAKVSDEDAPNDTNDEMIGATTASDAAQARAARAATEPEVLEADTDAAEEQGEEEEVFPRDFAASAAKAGITAAASTLANASDIAGAARGDAIGFLAASVRARPSPSLTGGKRARVPEPMVPASRPRNANSCPRVLGALRTVPTSEDERAVALAECEQQLPNAMMAVEEEAHAEAATASMEEEEEDVPTDPADTEEGEATSAPGEAPTLLSDTLTPSMESLMSVLLAVRAEVRADGLGPAAELQAACRTFAQQLGALGQAPPASARTDGAPNSDGADEEPAESLVSQLTLCACQYLKGWLLANGPASGEVGAADVAGTASAAAADMIGVSAGDAAALGVGISSAEIVSGLAVAGWQWHEETFEDRCAPSARAVAAAFDGLADRLTAAAAAAAAPSASAAAAAVLTEASARLKGKPRRGKARAPGPAAAAYASAQAARSGDDESDEPHAADESEALPLAASSEPSSASAASANAGRAGGGAASARTLLPEELCVAFDLVRATEQLATSHAKRRRRAFARESRAGEGSTAQVLSGGDGSHAAQTVPDAGFLDRATRVNGAELERELARTLPRSSFASMRVLGQFNLGFMVARSTRPRPEAALDDEATAVTAGEGGEPDEAALDRADLFIIDQHAADEKCRFESLQASTKIHTQRLLAPLPLHLTAADELLVVEHMHVFHANGFDITVEPSAPPTQRLRLVALPFSQHTVFGPSDVHELVTLLAEAPTTQCRLPKLRSMFAMRACRSAVMIGTALDAAKMSGLTRQLATLDQPWNCPHGRPTLRHLVDLFRLAETPAARHFELGRA